MRQFQWLSDEEVESLKKVPTSKTQAETIISRNEWLLDRLKKAAPHGYCKISECCFHGCPHCSHKDCLSCDWRFTDDDPQCSRYFCCFQSFAGVMYVKVANSLRFIHVTYGSEQELIECNPIHDPTDIFQWNKEYLQVFRFLSGHIEWGQAVLDGRIVPYNPVRFKGVPLASLRGSTRVLRLSGFRSPQVSDRAAYYTYPLS